MVPVGQVQLSPSPSLSLSPPLHLPHSSHISGGERREATPGNSNVAGGGSGYGVPRSLVGVLASFFYFSEIIYVDGQKCPPRLTPFMLTGFFATDDLNEADICPPRKTYFDCLGKELCI